MTPWDLALLVSGYILAMTLGFAAFRALLDWNDEREARRAALRRMREW